MFNFKGRQTSVDSSYPEVQKIIIEGSKKHFSMQIIVHTVLDNFYSNCTGRYIVAYHMRGRGGVGDLKSQTEVGC